MDDLNLERIDPTPWIAAGDDGHPPRLLALYGSLRERSFSRFAAEEAARAASAFGAEVRLFDPRGLPLVGDDDVDHPRVRALFDAVAWSEGMIWSSPERHGAMTGVMKTQIDWLPLSRGGVRPTQGKTLAVMQVCGGSQSFNTVNQLRVLGRWMRLVTIPNQSSIPKAWQAFDDDGRLSDSPLRERVVDVVEELVRFTYLTRGRMTSLADRHSERRESADEATARVGQGRL